MKALVLDFDGVLSDSAREAFLVARRAYLDLLPDSPLADEPEGPLLDPASRNHVRRPSRSRRCSRAAS